MLISTPTADILPTAPETPTVAPPSFRPRR